MKPFWSKSSIKETLLYFRIEDHRLSINFLYKTFSLFDFNLRALTTWIFVSCKLMGSSAPKPVGAFLPEDVPPPAEWRFEFLAFRGTLLSLQGIVY